MTKRVLADKFWMREMKQQQFSQEPSAFSSLVQPVDPYAGSRAPGNAGENPKDDGTAIFQRMHPHEKHAQ